MSAKRDIVIETILRFRIPGEDNSRGRVIHVAGNRVDIQALSKLLARVSDRGAGLPPGSVAEGVVADMNYPPSYFINSDGERMKDIPPQPAALLTFPRIPALQGKGKTS